MSSAFLRGFLLSLFLSLSFLSFHLKAQNTIGTVYQDSTLQEGYTLVFPDFQSDVYLIDACGQVVHSWEGQEDTAPGFSVYLDDGGNLIKAYRPNQDPDGVEVTGAGQSGFVEILDWDNNQIWSYEQIQGNRRLHHDIEVLPNGNILMNAWEIISLEEAYALGRDPETLISQNLYDEVIFEVDPATNEIVWEWKASDHLIQTFNTTGPNWVGNPSAWSHRIDLNYVGDSNRRNDWLHFNFIEYNSELDQIMISCPSFGEIWIIDHSTTTEEAKGSNGGKSGKGGDLMYRWGNPEAYNAGTVEDKKLYYQHATQFVSEQLSDKSQRKGEVVLFNNRQENFSSVDIITLPEFDTLSWNYIKDGPTYGPLEADRVVVHPVDSSLFTSSIMSSGQVLDNGNVLVNSTVQGTITEINTADTIAWEYVVPLLNGQALEQGASTALGGSLVFKSDKYVPSFPGFENKDLSPKGYLELNPDTTLCGLLDTMVIDTMVIDTMGMDTMMTDTMGVSIIEGLQLEDITLYPNPTIQVIQFSWSLSPVTYEIFSVDGKQVSSGTIATSEVSLRVRELQAGIYFIRLGHYGTKKFIKL